MDHTKDHTGQTMGVGPKTGSEGNPYSNYGLLAYLSTVIDKFHSLRSFVQSHNVNVAILFTPQVISLLDGEISRDPGIIYDTYLLVDLINLYSLEANDNIDTTFNEVANSIVKTRAIFNTEMVVSETTLDPYTVTDLESFSALLHSNKVLVALYLYILTTALF